MNNSRVNKYRDLREGLKDEAGINRENIEETISTVKEVEDDDFLQRINRSFEQQEKKVDDIHDTLTEAKTFDQMRQESSEEINRALRSAKVSVGKEAQYNTRMDILNKIREPEKQVIHIDNLDNVNTSEFSKGFFVNKEEKPSIDELPVEPPVSKEEEAKKAAKKKMTLMERLASMSPEEDAKKAEEVMEDLENGEVTATKQEETVEIKPEVKDEDKQLEMQDNEAARIEQTRSLEEMLRQIKEKDKRQVEKALKEKDTSENINVIKNEVSDNNIEEVSNVTRSEVVEEKKSDRIANILNYIIIFLVVVFIGLCGMIGYQLFL